MAAESIAQIPKGIKEAATTIKPVEAVTALGKTTETPNISIGDKPLNEIQKESALPDFDAHKMLTDMAQGKIHEGTQPLQNETPTTPQTINEKQESYDAQKAFRNLTFPDKSTDVSTASQKQPETTTPQNADSVEYKLPFAEGVVPWKNQDGLFSDITEFPGKDMLKTNNPKKPEDQREQAKPEADNANKTTETPIDKKPVNNDKKDWELVVEPSGPESLNKRISDIDKYMEDTQKNLTSLKELMEKNTKEWNENNDKWTETIKNDKFKDIIKLSSDIGKFENQLDQAKLKKYEYSQKLADLKTTDQSANPGQNEQKPDEQTGQNNQEKTTTSLQEKTTTSLKDIKDAANEKPMEETEKQKTEQKDQDKDEKAKHTEQLKQMQKITSQLKDLDPKFDQTPQGQDLLNKLAENPDQIEKVSEKFDKVNEQGKAIDDLANKTGIDGSKLKAFILNQTVQNEISQLTEKLEKSAQEQTVNPDTQKQEEDKKDGILLTILKALGALLAAGAAGMAAATKEIQKG